MIAALQRDCDMGHHNRLHRAYQHLSIGIEQITDHETAQAYGQITCEYGGLERGMMSENVKVKTVKCMIRRSSDCVPR